MRFFFRTSPPWPSVGHVRTAYGLLSDRQLRTVAAAADLLPVKACGTFLQRVTAELRGRRDFSDCDIEEAVRAAVEPSEAMTLVPAVAILEAPSQLRSECYARSQCPCRLHGP